MKLAPTVRDALVFQLGWFACVLGGNAAALAAAALLLPLQALWPGRRDAREWALTCVFAALGLAMDLGWQRLGLLRFEGAGALGIAPWLAVLWLFFAGTLFRSLAFLQHRLALAALLGAVGGPLSYVAGIELGAATSVHPDWMVALAMAPAWALLLPLLARLAREPSRAAEAAA